MQSKYQQILKEKLTVRTIVGDFDSPLTSMARSSRQKIYKETLAFKNILDDMDLINLYRIFHPKAEKYILFEVHMEISPE